jgi:hypothetical protein
MAMISLECGDVEVEIRERKRGDVSIYSAEGGAATRQTTPELRHCV